MDRSTIALFLIFSLALFFAGVCLGLSALPFLVLPVKTRPLSSVGIVCAIVLVAIGYLCIRGLYCLLSSIRWVARNWKHSRREDLARRGLLVGWLPAFALPRRNRPRIQALEYAELSATLIFSCVALGYMYSAGICTEMLEPGESCLEDTAFLLLGPFVAMFFSYIFRWGPQPEPTGRRISRGRGQCRLTIVGGVRDAPAVWRLGR